MPGFNPRARDGRDTIGIKTGNFISVSIHAPVMGATVAHVFVVLVLRVSIHAPVMGATGPVGELASAGGGFNPRARDGRD